MTPEAARRTKGGRKRARDIEQCYYIETYQSPHYPGGTFTAHNNAAHDIRGWARGGTYLYSFLIKYDRRRSVGLRKRTELLHRKRAWLRRLRKSPAQ